MFYRSIVLAVVLGCGLGSVGAARAEPAANSYESNKLAANRIAFNRIAFNRIAFNRISNNNLAATPTAPGSAALGVGAVVDVAAIELPDGTLASR